MVYSSIPVTPSKVKKQDTALQPIEDGIISVKEEDPPLMYPPSIFSDKKGNLKFVNLVVRNPCLMFFLILALCIMTTVILFNAAFAEGNPFTPDDSTFDLYDKRSLAYDALRLAKEDVGIMRDTSTPSNGNEEPEEETKIQENLGDVTYWIYEAKTDEGVFTEDAIKTMRSAEVLFTKQKQYPNYCLLEYTGSGNETTSKCKRELSVLNAFYASSWNSTIANSVIDELTVGNIQLYNSIAACVELNQLCQYNPPSVTEQDIEWAKDLNTRMKSIMDHWDGEGDLNENMDEVTQFVAHVKALSTKAPYVNFFVDGNFTIDNPVSMYSRSIVYWGAPLKNANDTSPNSKTSSNNLLKK